MKQHRTSEPTREALGCQAFNRFRGRAGVVQASAWGAERTVGFWPRGKPRLLMCQQRKSDIALVQQLRPRLLSFDPTHFVSQPTSMPPMIHARIRRLSPSSIMSCLRNTKLLASACVIADRPRAPPAWRRCRQQASPADACRVRRPELPPPQGPASIAGKSHAWAGDRPAVKVQRHIQIHRCRTQEFRQRMQGEKRVLVVSIRMRPAPSCLLPYETVVRQSPA